MPTLTPVEAAKIANGVYGLRKRSISDLRSLHIDLGCEELFDVGEAKRFEGTSGGPMNWKEVSGFGYLASGIGQHQGEVLIACRGTEIVADWVTDANAGGVTGPTGSTVHAGFMTTFRSFSHEIDAFLSGRTPSTIHCVGHSLGGALATLTAAHLIQGGAGQPELYTFGSPRVGLSAFASDLTSRAGSSRIHRVYHFADPVSMVPLWPFAHVAYGALGNVIGGHRTTVISPGAHSMDSSYLPATAGMSWSTLSATTDRRTAGERAQEWLNSLANGQESIIPMGAYAFGMLGTALAWLVDTASDLISATVGPLVLGTLTIIDEIAVLLERAAELTAKMSWYVTVLVNAILQFVGRTVSTGVDLTREFLRWALQALFTPIRLMARSASQLMVG